MLDRITMNNKDIYTIFRFNKLQRFFILEAFNKGLLYQYLSKEDIGDVDAMLNYFTSGTDSFAWNFLNGFKSGQIPQKDVYSKFEFDKKQIESYIKITQTLKEKLKKLN